MDSLDRTMSNMVAFIQLKAGAVRRHVLDKLRDIRHSVLDYGADPTGANDSTAAFVAARAASSGAYHIPAGLYKTDAASLGDHFSAERGAAITIGGITYDASHAFYGRWMWGGEGGYLYIRDFVTGNVPIAIGANTLGFFGTVGTTKPVVSGDTSDAGTLALASALASLGLVVNSLTYTAPPAPTTQ